ncbi:hypothetical protein [Streptomyces sp. NPDC096339]|uniref:hypothetical protein n=1 Tax=Streptomyces sp. NPDC096339 TaxID=3366086 RepID=UPI0038290FFB
MSGEAERLVWECAALIGSTSDRDEAGLTAQERDLSAAPQLTKAPRFTNNPGMVEKALAIYNGTYP